MWCGQAARAAASRCRVSRLSPVSAAPSCPCRRPDALVFVEKTNATIGSKYRKAVYRAYTDASFSQRVRSAAAPRWSAAAAGVDRGAPGPHVWTLAGGGQPPLAPAPAHLTPRRCPDTRSARTQAPAPEAQGILGPTLAVEVGQRLELVFKNAVGCGAVQCCGWH